MTPILPFEIVELPFLPGDMRRFKRYTDPHKPSPVLATPDECALWDYLQARLKQTEERTTKSVKVK